METPIEKAEYKEFTINIFPDDSPMNPREYDNLGHMICWHKRYDLGDKHIWSSPRLFQEWANEQDGKLFLLPLYLYDHSGITMRTSPFCCPWDSGQVGYIYATREEALKEFGVHRVTKAFREKIGKILGAEVVSYDKYLTGAFVGFQIHDKDGEYIESCWGFDDVEYAILEAKGMVDCYVQKSVAA